MKNIFIFILFESLTVLSIVGTTNSGYHRASGRQSGHGKAVNTGLVSSSVVSTCCTQNSELFKVQSAEKAHISSSW